MDFLHGQSSSSVVAAIGMGVTLAASFTASLINCGGGNDLRAKEARRRRRLKAARVKDGKRVVGRPKSKRSHPGAPKRSGSVGRKSSRGRSSKKGSSHKSGRSQSRKLSRSSKKDFSDKRSGKRDIHKSSAAIKKHIIKAPVSIKSGKSKSHREASKLSKHSRDSHKSKSKSSQHSSKSSKKGSHRKVKSASTRSKDGQPNKSTHKPVIRFNEKNLTETLITKYPPPRLSREDLLEATSTKWPGETPKSPTVGAHSTSKSPIAAVPLFSIDTFNLLSLKPKVLHFVWNQNKAELVVLSNITKERLAIKVKCSDNKVYRVNPVFMFCKPGESVNVLVRRDTSASVKIDKLVFVVVKVDSNKNDPRKVFKTGAKNEQMYVLPIFVSDKNTILGTAVHHEPQLEQENVRPCANC